MNPEPFFLPSFVGQDPSRSVPLPPPGLVGEQLVRDPYELPTQEECKKLVSQLAWVAAQLDDIDWKEDSASVTLAATYIQRISAEVLELESIVVGQQPEHTRHSLKVRRQRRLVRPGESVADAPPLSWAENPPPNEVDPLVVVVSQQTAVRALVRHYGWVHDGPDTLVRPRYQVRPSVGSSGPAPGGGAVEDLVEAPGSIADHAAAAAAAVE